LVVVGGETLTVVGGAVVGGAVTRVVVGTFAVVLGTVGGVVTTTWMMVVGDVTGTVVFTGDRCCTRMGVVVVGAVVGGLGLGPPVAGGGAPAATVCGAGAVDATGGGVDATVAEGAWCIVNAVTMANMAETLTPVAKPRAPAA
jgi:hypothetical protein